MILVLADVLAELDSESALMKDDVAAHALRGDDQIKPDAAQGRSRKRKPIEDRGPVEKAEEPVMVKRGADDPGRKTRKDQKAEAKHQVDAACRADVRGKRVSGQWLAPVGAGADARGRGIILPILVR